MTSPPLELMGTSSLIGVNLWSAIAGSDLVGWFCLAVLLVFSLYSWSVIWLGAGEMRRAKAQNNRFRHAAGARGTLERAFVEAENYPESPRAGVLRAAWYEIHAEGWPPDRAGLTLEHQLESARDTIERAIDRAANDEASRLEARLPTLAAASSICPFIGLFGTVWGVLAAFQSLAIGGGADIQTLAPGISTALMTTIGGLAAAIPAAVAHNYFAAVARGLIADMDSYALDLSNVFQRETLRRREAMEAAA